MIFTTYFYQTISIVRERTVFFCATRALWDICSPLDDKYNMLWYDLIYTAVYAASGDNK